MKLGRRGVGFFRRRVVGIELYALVSVGLRMGWILVVGHLECGSVTLK